MSRLHDTAAETRWQRPVAGVTSRIVLLLVLLRHKLGTDDDSTLFDEGMLQRYILLCAQDVHGGLRDKPLPAIVIFLSRLLQSIGPRFPFAQHYARE
jgi:hypothetical protein